MVKSEKCELFVKKVGFLGFTIDDGKVAMEEQKLAGIADWRAPTTQKQVRSFIGFCNFYRRFISHYSNICKPLNDLLRKNKVWEWTNEHYDAFNKLKAAFVSRPVLIIPDYSKPFIIEADASLFATGAVLLQEDANGDEHPAGYISHTLTYSQSRRTKLSSLRQST